jgi:phenylalanyl-tRNA synthetase beta chain
LVRRATTDEKLITLDGENRSLDPDDLVIADAERPVALAGVMGGAETEVTEKTVDVLLESAHFDAASIRRTARRHGLSTEASYRFERGVDPDGLDRAIDRAARLLAELAGGQVAPGRCDDRGEAAAPLEAIEIQPAWVNRLLGTRLDKSAMRDALIRLDIPSEETGGGALRCAIPSHRNDLRIPADLVEEIARMIGYENIDATLPLARLAPASRPPAQELVERARDVASSLGWSECMTLPMESSAAHDALGLHPEDPRRRAVTLLNPLVEDERLLRTSLVPSLLGVVRQNLARQRPEVRAFEVGRVFQRSEGPLPEERVELALALAGRAEGVWDGEVSPFFEVKGVAERLLAGFGSAPRWKADAEEPFLHPGASARAVFSKQVVAVVGELHPELALRAEIDAPCALLVVNIDALAKQAKPEVRYEPVSRQPSVRRDLAILVDRVQAAGSVLSTIRQNGGALLQGVTLFDRYEGKGVPEGKVSLGVRLVFQHGERTLTESEVAKAMDRVVRTLGQQFGAELR